MSRELPVAPRSRLSRVVREVLPPAVLFGLVLLAWQLATTTFGVSEFLIPKPASVWQAATVKGAELRSATLMTAAAALSGFAASLIVGTLIAFAFSQARIIRTSCYPYAIFLQTVPVVAIAPIIVTWFGYGFQSVVIVAFLLSLFPIITNATTGLTSAERELVELFQLYGATRWQRLWKLQLPTAVPWILTGARTASGLSVVGAIVGEFFAGASSERSGLGYAIRAKLEAVKQAELFAAVFASTLLGVAIFSAVSLAGATLFARWATEGGRRGSDS
jgi:NitT/TauT family transport system permease protein